MPMPGRRKALVSGVAVVVLGAIGFGLWVYLRPPSTPSSLEDPLCKMVRERFSMRCAPLASPGVYERGALVLAPPGGEQRQATALPDDYLFSPECVFDASAVGSASFKEDPGRVVDFGKHSYKLDRNASAGVTLNLPKVAGLTFKAGPKVAEIREIVLEADSARYFNIDSQAFQTSLKSCAIRPACIERAKAASRHCRLSTLISISAMLSQLPCLGV